MNIVNISSSINGVSGFGNHEAFVKRGTDGGCYISSIVVFMRYTILDLCNTLKQGIIHLVGHITFTLVLVYVLGYRFLC